MPATDCAIAELIGLLMDQSISVLADVRQFPGLKRQPQFAKDSLESSLREVVIGYRHFEALGGRRTAKRIGDSVCATPTPPPRKAHEESSPQNPVDVPGLRLGGIAGGGNALPTSVLQG